MLCNSSGVGVLRFTSSFSGRYVHCVFPSNHVLLDGNWRKNLFFLMDMHPCILFCCCLFTMLAISNLISTPFSLSIIAAVLSKSSRAFASFCASAKEEKMSECAKVLYNVLESMRFIAALLAPYTPNISQDIYEQLNRTEKASDVRLDDLKWGEIPAGVLTEKSKIKPVFLRLDSEIAGAAKKG